MADRDSFRVWCLSSEEPNDAEWAKGGARTTDTPMKVRSRLVLTVRLGPG